MQLSSSKNTAPILVSVLVIVLLFALYYYVVLPKQEERNQLQTSVNSLQTEISSIETQIAQAQDEQSNMAANEFVMRKKLPDNRDVDDLLRSMEEVAFVTNSKISSLAFNNYDALVADAVLNDPTAQQAPTGTEVDPQTGEVVQGDQAEQTENATEAEQTPVSALAENPLPANLKLVTYTVSVESPDYEKLQAFLEELEGLERVMHVDTISYSLPGEEQEFSLEQAEAITAEMQVTTFYFENM